MNIKEVLKIFWDELGKKAFLIVFLALVSAILSTAAIAIINDLISDNPTINPLVYPAVVLTSFFLSKKFSMMMLRISAHMTYKYRIDMLSKIQNISLANFEKKNKDNESFIYSILTRDISLLTSIPGTIVALTTSIFTLISSFVYLFSKSVIGTLVVLGIVMFAFVAFRLATRGIDKFDQQLRKLSDRHFNFINMIIRGFREFKLDSKKQKDFKENYMDDSSEKLRSFTVKFGRKIINAEIFNDLIFYSIIALFFFVNSIINVFDAEMNRLFILTFIFIGDNIMDVVNIFPYLTRVNTSLERIHEIEEFFRKEKEIEHEHAEKNHLLLNSDIKWENIKLDDVSFKYENDDNYAFEVGPLSMKINRGDVIFITGGNGSGKTTFMKLLLSLYEPSKGSIVINDEHDVFASRAHYRNMFSVIFSDNFLFKYLYGYSKDVVDEDIDKLIKKLGLENKVMVEDGKFDTIDLSMGQRKRLALLYMLIEDKELIVLDEFTADQDPSFREYFYKQILKELKEMGKTLIIITHDDRYFHYGDRLFKMEYGNIRELELEDTLIK